MAKTDSKAVQNPLGTEPIGKLLRKFAIPSIISMLVMSLYNIVDQIFIGQSVGELGNAATNVTFPLTTLCLAASLAFGIGASSGFNLNMGAGQKGKAPYFIGNAAFMMVALGIIIAVIAKVALSPILTFFGSTETVLPYAVEYAKYLSWGFPFAILSTGGAHLVRADGAPKFSMACNLTGAIINVVLDYIFVMVLGFGMSGAAVATVIGQVVASIMVVWHLLHYRTVKLKLRHFRPHIKVIGKTVHLGMAQGLNQLAMMLVQVLMNKSLTYYGALSSYGADIPLACTGIVMKVNQVFFSFCIGVSQGMQPIASFNRGAGKIDRVKQTYKVAISINIAISVVAFLIFQIFPRQILDLFGSESPEYYQFAIGFFRIFLFMTFLDGIQPLSSTFFTAIGQANRGTFLSLTRQVIFFIPLLIIAPILFEAVGRQGVDGIMYVAPISDFIAAVISVIMIRNAFKRLTPKAPKSGNE